MTPNTLHIVISITSVLCAMHQLLNIFWNNHFDFFENNAQNCRNDNTSIKIMFHQQHCQSFLVIIIKLYIDNKTFSVR